ncbi:MAG: hypothetical protein M3Q60_01300 [Actinomycetota bacterium]|nr:hypothetical protein [Actinomycetota bacterium]
MKRISAVVPTSTRLTTDVLVPEVDAVAACGAYHSRGAGRSTPWSKYLRLSKAPPTEDEERRAVFSTAARYFSRCILKETDLLKAAEVVVPVPANPNRYGDRMASLPDELARGVERYLALRMLPNTIAWVPEMTYVEMKKLRRAERLHLSTLTFRSGNQAGRVANRGVLLVDDIMTSGSTLRACARVLLDAGATHVVACCLVHTEG